MALITFEDKVSLNPQPSVADKNKVKDSDMNMIKNAVNNSTTYSTTEQVVGEWIDGKPLYRKVFSGTTGTSELTIDMSSLNISQLVKSYGMVGASGDFKPIPFILEASGTIYYISTRYAFGTMYISNSSAYGSLPFYLIVEYTKTTD